MSGVTMPFTAPQGEIWQLSGITPFAMALMQSLLRLDSTSPGNQLFVHQSLAMNAVGGISVSTGGKRAVSHGP